MSRDPEKGLCIDGSAQCIGVNLSRFCNLGGYLITGSMIGEMPGPSTRTHCFGCSAAWTRLGQPPERAGIAVDVKEADVKAKDRESPLPGPEDSAYERGDRGVRANV